MFCKVRCHLVNTLKINYFICIYYIVKVLRELILRTVQGDVKAMSLKVYMAEESVTAYLTGEIDHHSAKGMREEIDETVQRASPDELILDFKDVTFMDSSGIGLVMGRYALMQEFGGTLKVVNLSSHIKKVMKLAGLDRLAVIEN